MPADDAAKDSRIAELEEKLRIAEFDYKCAWPEAQARIAELEAERNKAQESLAGAHEDWLHEAAEVARLREALERIAREPDRYMVETGEMVPYAAIAREALAGGGQ